MAAIGGHLPMALGRCDPWLVPPKPHFPGGHHNEILGGWITGFRTSNIKPSLLGTRSQVTVYWFPGLYVTFSLGLDSRE